MSSDATAVLKRKQPAGKSKGWRKATIVWTSIGLMCAICVTLVVLWMIGITHGREFDAANWTFRSFTFVRNPFTGKQVTGIQRSSDFPVPPTITALVRGGPLAPTTRWDLVELYKGPSHCVGEAQVLLDYLSALDQENNYFWDHWTTAHPKAAPVLWSAVRDCVHLPRYDRLPEIFEAARATTDPAELKSRLTEIMLAIIEDEKKLQTELGNDAAKKRAQSLADAYLKPSEKSGVKPSENQPADEKPKAEIEQIP